MNKSKAKKLAMAAVSTVLSTIMCFSFAACKDNTDKSEQPDNPAADYYREGTVSANGLTSGFTEEKGKFYADYNSLDECHEAGKQLNVRLAEEGDVLLKNENSALPLSRDERNVSLFGIKSVDIQTGGGGSGAGMPGQYGIPITTLEKSMENAGFNVNKKLLDLYKNNISGMSYTVPSAGSTHTLTAELPLSYYSDMVTKTYRSYNDAAIITFSRTGSEGTDLVMHDIPGYTDKNSHILELSDAEKALIKHVKQNFKKVIVLINSSNIMEVGELNAPKTNENLGVDAILWVGHTGNDGAAAIGRILNGEVNPSGHTVDLWSRDFQKDPSYNNFGDMTQVGLDNYVYCGSEDTGFRTVEYREDIYNGYRYYETVAHDKNAAEAGTGDSWYNENVVYPFGYGLSYTSFEWELDEKIAPSAKIEAANSTVTMKVKVTNTGDIAGKDVVQVYASTPYTPGGIEKASTVLMGFEKTKLLKPGESETLTIQFVAQDMASFDWNDKNNNGFAGYELEKGDYTITLNKNSHEVVSSVTRTIEEDILCKTDLVTGNEIKAVFSQTDGFLADYNSTNDSLLANLMSRNGDMTQPAAATKEDRTISRALYDMLEGRKDYAVSQDSEDDAWYVDSVPSNWKQAASHEEGYTDVTTKIYDMSGITYSEPVVENGKVKVGTDEGTKKWDEFMNQLTWDELCFIASHGSYSRPGVDSIALPFQVDIDGPAQVAWYGNSQISSKYPTSDKNEWTTGMGTNWVSAVVVASTWSKDLADKQGVMVGNECLLTNTTGWYGPSLNGHRNPLAGRNFEYYSEDPVVSGLMVAAVTNGATSKGVVCYAKHIFLNEQETNRDTKRGLCTYATEQAIREIYLKPFEYVIKSGASLGTMAAANRIGNYVAYGNYALHTAILRGEWNFQGINLTDAASSKGSLAYSSMNQMLRNGVDLPLGTGTPDASDYPLDCGQWNAQENMVYVNANADDKAFTLASPTQYYVVRNAAQHVLYASANSNGINNGIINVSDVSLTFGALETVNKIIVEPASFGASAYDKVQIKEGKLPAGIALSETGMLTGKPTEAGTFNLTISLRGDGWVNKDVKVTITVNNGFEYSGTDMTTATTSTVFNGTFSSVSVKMGDTASTTIPGLGALSAPVSSITYNAVGLPEGLTLAADGTLTGTPATAGTYTVSVTMTATGVAVLWGGYMKLPITQTFTQLYTIVVA